METAVTEAFIKTIHGLGKKYREEVEGEERGCGRRLGLLLLADAAAAAATALHTAPIPLLARDRAAVP
mgnify:CR=1 FL=1